MMNTKTILTAIAIALAFASYFKAPTLGASVILLGVANLIP